MRWFKSLIRLVVDSGLTKDTKSSDARYVRFLNTTLLLFGLSQLPVTALLLFLGLRFQLFVNLVALGGCVVGFFLNRRGNHLPAKVLVISVVSLNAAYFAGIIGSSAPAHIWFIPFAVLGVLVF